MNNELATRDNGYSLVSTNAPLRLIEWAQEADAAHKLAQNLCQTSFAGAFQGNAIAGAAAILRGSEIGFSPAGALAAFDLIQGQPALKAIGIRAAFLYKGHEFWIETSTPTECVAKARRKGETNIHESKWTIQRATALGLTSKDNWKKQPQAMLVARATSEVCRIAGADVLLGIAYSKEELEDDETQTVTITRSEPTTIKRAVKEKPFVAEPEIEEVLATPTLVIAPSTVNWGSDEPDLDEPTGAGEVSWDSAVSAISGITQLPDLITEKQLKLVQVLFKKTGLVERDAALNYVKSIINREIESSSELTKQEATKIIDSLKIDEEALA